MLLIFQVLIWPAGGDQQSQPVLQVVFRGKLEPLHGRTFFVRSLASRGHTPTPQQSGKLVQKMFGKIQELIDDPDALICVLIDEASHKQ